MAEPASNTTRVAPGVELRDSDLDFTFSRSGGPGGQNVNKVNSKATLTVSHAALERALPPYALRRLERVAGRYLTQEGVQIAADDSRSQHANRKACLDRLREVLIEAMHRPKVRKKTRPSKRSNQRRLDAKKQRGRIKRLRKGKDV